MRLGIYADILRGGGSGGIYLKNLLENFKGYKHKIKIILISDRNFNRDNFQLADKVILFKNPKFQKVFRKGRYFKVGNFFRDVNRVLAVKNFTDVIHIPN
ncbi:MAG: hypothetical protein ACFFDN_17300, partial [Candidatus Hodarchaeota archaeon]